MILRVFSLYDSKVEAYLQPMFLRTANEAIRAITSYVNQPDHHFAKNAPDLTLFELGVWDDSNAKFVLHDAKVNLGNLVEFRKDYAQG